MFVNISLLFIIELFLLLDISLLLSIINNLSGCLLFNFFSKDPEPVPGLFYSSKLFLLANKLLLNLMLPKFGLAITILSLK